MALLAYFRLDDLRQRLRSDPLLGTLGEAVIALPFSNPTVARLAGRADYGALVSESIAMVRPAISALRGSSAPHELREAMYTFADLRSLQYLLCKPSSLASAEIAASLGMSAAHLLRRC